MLKRLDEMLKEMDSYQAAFLKNRSVDDHIYALKTFLDMEWTSGQVLYVLSLDLSKAFDEVDLHTGITILRGYKIPDYFINRIIKACMWETTCVLWNGQTTPPVVKSKGVKQGCCFSPRFFTLIMDAVLQTVADLFDLDLNYTTGLRSPLILAYADDVIVVCKDKALLISIFEELSTLFSSVGLRFNISKTMVMIRDPLNISSEPTSEIQLGSVSVKRVHEIRYLGMILTSTLSRGDIIRKRCGMAKGIGMNLARFVREFRISDSVVKLMYNSVIFPTMTFGLKGSALTKANRDKLRRYEKEIIIAKDHV